MSKSDGGPAFPEIESAMSREWLKQTVGTLGRFGFGVINISANSIDVRLLGQIRNEFLAESHERERRAGE